MQGGEVNRDTASLHCGVHKIGAVHRAGLRVDLRLEREIGALRAWPKLRSGAYLALNAPRVRR